MMRKIMPALAGILIAAGALQARAATVTIGETNVLVTDDYDNANLLLAQNAPLAQAATIESLSFYVSQAAGKLRLGIYDSTGANGGPGLKKAETAEITPVVGWNTANVVAPTSLPAGTYWLAYTTNYNSLHFVKGQTAGVHEVNVGRAYGAMPTTFPTPSGGDSSHWSFYATLNTTGSAPNIAAVKVNDFLNSLGANTKFDQGADPAKTLPMIQYLGLRTLRAGGSTAPLVILHNQTGVLFDIGLGSGPTDATISTVLANARTLASAGALTALEGANEPNNFGGTYQGQSCCIHSGTWAPMAKMQRDFYSAVKADPVLKNYPVFDVSEVGAETSNVGMQYLTIPTGAGSSMPTGTVYADYANNHNYAVSNCSGYHDNQAFNASVPYGVLCYDDIFNENGVTWAKDYNGYSQSALATLPKVTTETGWWTDGTPTGDDRQGKIFLNIYLDQYKQGWKYTYIYEIMDFTDGKDGFYANYTTPRKSANYLHNLTTILADNTSAFTAGQLSYFISNEPATVHDMLMQKSNGLFELAVWGEQASGSNNVTVSFGSTHSSVKVYDPTVGTTPIKTFANVGSVPLTMSDHAFILEVQ
ncbi:hypothetical protein RZS28_14990 [Methylocapsa polymorpha]|uniref:Beta-glucuronidase C-terminal domain-containing protein n=1 Tax=Methylocapsa polymorpha TaxID=3080828 RepID=A0ABZ0HQC3_9HYPH|nr:hypothetical protein RZS28_14990 [Methylocapsa sp. RX1]